MADNYFEGFEIPDELLEGISGGVLDDLQLMMLRKVLPTLKQEGYSKESAMGLLGLENKPELYADVLAYVNSVWDTL